jgi:RHS repeat-associated protein
MGLSTAFYTVDGEIIGESSSGTRMDYLTDALGSVTAKADQTGNVASSARYKPYGDKLSGTDYTFGWVGSYGYRKAVNGSYVRARHYSVTRGNWTTVDRLWPDEQSYAYALGNPTKLVDPTGTSCQNCCCVPTFLMAGHTPIENGPSIFTPKELGPWYGNYIRIKFATGAVDSEIESDCTLQWFECSNAQLPSGPAYRWNEATGKTMEFDQWTHRGFNCRSKPQTSGSLYDEPKMKTSHIKKDSKDWTISVVRHLFILIRIKGCKDTKIELRLYQAVGFNASPDFNRAFTYLGNGFPSSRSKIAGCKDEPPT